MKTFYILSLFALITISCNSNKPAFANSSSDYQVPEASQIKDAIDSTYKSFSYKRAVKLDLQNIKNKFIPEAHIIKFENNVMQVLTVDQFADYLDKLMTGNGLDSFDDEEVYGKTEQFGKIAHRISSYKLYVNTKDTVAQRGVNSFQLVKTTKGWRIASLTWDTQTQALQIPRYYLKPDSANK